MSDYYNNRDFNYNAYINDRNFNYNASRDAVADQRYNQEWQYNIGRDTVSDDRYASETAYNRVTDLLAMGIMPDSTLLTQAGMTTSQAQNYLASLAAKKATSSSRSSGSSGSKSSRSKNNDGYNRKSKSDASVGDLKTTRVKGKAVGLSSYANGLYTDIVKGGYSLSDIDDILTNQVNKKYITKDEADILADKLIGN